MFTLIKHAEMRCLECRHPVNAQAGISDSIPAEGDISVCLRCGALATFTAGGVDAKIRAMTDEELADLKSDGDVWAALEKVRARIGLRSRKLGFEN